MTDMLRISLKASRVNAEMLIKDVAEKLGVTPRTVENWEKKKSTPSVEQAKALSELYKMPLDNIIF